MCKVWFKSALWFLRRSINVKSLLTNGKTDGRRTKGDQNSTFFCTPHDDGRRPIAGHLGDSGDLQMIITTVLQVILLVPRNNKTM